MASVGLPLDMPSIHVPAEAEKEPEEAVEFDEHNFGNSILTLDERGRLHIWLGVPSAVVVHNIVTLSLYTYYP